MTDWVASRSFLCQKIPKNSPKMRRDYPKTTLTLCKALFAQIERTAQPPQAQLNTSLIKIKA